MLESHTRQIDTLDKTSMKRAREQKEKDKKNQEETKQEVPP